jgi:transposase InsO family protein
MKTMPTSTAEERYRWIRPIVDGDISVKSMAKACPFSKRTLQYWLSRYREFGLAGLKNQSRRPRSSPWETPIRIKERIIELRSQDKKCAFKLNNDLRKEGITIGLRTIGKIIKAEGLTRKYRTRKLKYKYIKVPLTPGELVEIDVKYVPRLLDNRQYYQFTAIDCATRWRYLKIYEDYSNLSSVSFLKELVKVAHFRIRAVKTDNGSYFTNRYTGYEKSTDPLNPQLHDFDLLCQKMNIIHYLIDPGKPAQNGKVERSHRSDQESFYDQVDFQTLNELQYKLKLWNMYYNDLQHCGLSGLTPNEALSLGVQKVSA